MAKIDENSIAKLKALFQDNEKALGSNFSQLIDFFNDNKVTDNGDGTFSVGNTIINVKDIVQEPEVRSMILSQLKASPDFATKSDVTTAVSAATANLADDSKVVHKTGDEEISGSKTFDVAPIDKATGNPYITKSDAPKVDLSNYATQQQLATKADTSAIAPSVMIKNTLTADDDVFTLDAGTYLVWNIAPKNYPTNLVPWGLVTIKTLLYDGNKIVEASDTNNIQMINIYAGIPAAWQGWQVPNSDIMATKTDVTTAVNTAISNMVGSTPPSLAIADDGTYTITAPATTSTPIVKYFLYYNVDGQSGATKLDVGTKLTGSLKELITKPGTTTTYDVQATAMHANTESGASNSVQFTYVPIDESIYGASWDRKGSPTLTRTDAAVGLKAGINGAQNDFDNVGPWKDMHRVTDSMNNVFVRVPKFYIRKTQTGNSDNGTATWQVSLVSHGDDWYLPKGFWDFTNSKELDYIDIGAYDATGSSSKLTSVAGKAPLVSLSIVEFRSAAKANGTGYQIWDIHAWDMLQVLFIIEFATLNSQSIMEGIDNGSSAANSGAADSHKGSSGTAGSGSNTMSYRGIENLYGNVWQLCDGVNFKDNQPWICEDATKYQSDLFAAPYVRTGYAATSSDSNNYIKALGFDSVHPYAQFATDDSGSGSTYYADCDWPGSGNIILETGGGWGAGALVGLFVSSRGASSSAAGPVAGCRLLKKALS